MPTNQPVFAQPVQALQPALMPPAAPLAPAAPQYTPSPVVPSLTQPSMPSGPMPGVAPAPPAEGGLEQFLGVGIAAPTAPEPGYPAANPLGPAQVQPPLQPAAQPTQPVAGQPTYQPVPGQGVPSAPPAPVPPGQTPPPAPSLPATGGPVPASQFVDRLAGLGFTNITNDADGVQRLLEAFETGQDQHRQLTDQVQRLQPMEQTAADHHSLIRDPAFQAWRAAQVAQGVAQPGVQAVAPQQQFAAPQAGVPQDSWWNPPALDEHAVSRQRVMDPDGKTFGWKTGTPLELQHAFDSRQSYIDAWAENLVQRPQEVLPPIIKQTVMPMVSEMVKQALADRDFDAFEKGIADEHGGLLFQQDPRTGQVAIDPLTNERVVSPAGRQILGHVDYLEKQGLGSQDAWDYAMAKFTNETGAPAPANGNGHAPAAPPAQALPATDFRHLTPPPPTGPLTASGYPAPANYPAPVSYPNPQAQALLDQTADARKREFLATYQPDRGGSFPAPENPTMVPQNQHLDAGNLLIQNMQAAGLPI